MSNAARVPIPKVRKHLRHTLLRTSESKGHEQLYNSSAPFEPEVRHRTHCTDVRNPVSGHAALNQTSFNCVESDSSLICWWGMILSENRFPLSGSCPGRANRTW